MKYFALALFFTVQSTDLFSQINAKLMQYVDVSDRQITFVYGGDVWLAPKTGGTAVQVTSSPGEESWPRFSPNGDTIAYTGQYNGNLDVYTIPVTGGIPNRVTYQSGPDRMVDWHPDGTSLLFASRRELGQRSSRQFFSVPRTGGLPAKLAVPYGELASYSPDGNKLAYITKITENYPFKRYRGGLTSDVIIFDLETNTAENITNNTANDGKPVWVGNTIYFLSDQGENLRINLWAYNTEDKTSRQITTYEDFDISHMSAGPSDLVFEKGGALYLMDLETEAISEVKISVISDLAVEMPQSKDVSSNIENMTAAPGGKRIVFEARGELFNLPVKEGFTMNLTRSSDAFDQQPAWSPDGKQLAYWSDRGGEYEIYLQSSDWNADPRQLTNRGRGFGYALNWSPDSKKLAFIDETNTIQIVIAASGEVIKAGHTNWHLTHPARYRYNIAWSPDSKWITFNSGLENAQNAIFVYSLDQSKRYQITNGFYEDYGAAFSTDGKYLLYMTNRNMSPIYSDMDATWVYPNSTQIGAIALTKEIASPLAPKNDELKTEEQKDEAAATAKGKKKKDASEDDEEEEKSVVVKIDFNDIESRLVLLPPKPGNMMNLMPVEKGFVYHRVPNSGSGDESSSLMYYDFEDREEKQVIGDVSSAKLTADGKSILVSSKGKYGVISPKPDQKIEDPIPTDGLVMDLVPKEEWRQIFSDTWRRYRDFFYDPNMHKVAWDELRTRYGALIEDARTRWDVSNIQSNLQAELSAGHTYTFGGDAESFKPRNTGFLGIDWELSNGKYRIKRIVRPAPWNTEVRSPFDIPGAGVAEGDYILAVNGVSIDPTRDPYAAFEGLAGKTVQLTVSRSGAVADAESKIIECLSPGDEARLRYLEWVENNRKLVDELSDGQLGYIYMSNTAGQGQRELVAMYYGQLDKKGFIIDERFNGGGQLADRFLELMQRPVVYNLHWRHGRDHQWPIKTNTGPMGMLINGWAGSGGDGLPWAFKELEAGPIVGERTLGILVGPATGHQLIDGGGITVPGGRLYDNDGHWFWEGEGVAPDIEVWDDPNLLVQGRDPQMERVVAEVLKLLDDAPKATPAPPYEDRTAAGLKGKK